MKVGTEEAVRQFLIGLGIDLEEQGLAKTPSRVTKLYKELFRGMQETSKDVWGEIFPTDFKGLMSVMNIPFYSMCEHHLMPFFGTVDIIYQPKNGRVAGLSKFGKLVEVFARRPQLQERLTNNIADAIEEDLDAEGVMVRLKGTHLCMLIRGEMQEGTQIVTLESRGALQKNGSLRDEAFAIMGGTKEDV